jgi:hypothetical protein
VGGVRRDGLFAHPPDHGRTVAYFPLSLPGSRGAFRSWAGIGDGSRSDGVLFIVEFNGRELCRRLLRPGKWELLRADLTELAGRDVPDPRAGIPGVLSLITDSAGSFDCDWAYWGEPTIEPVPRR